jgi:hypothetical protein
MKHAIPQESLTRGWENFGIGCLRHAQVFLRFLVSRIAPQRFIELEIWPWARYTLPKLL